MVLCLLNIPVHMNRISYTYHKLLGKYEITFEVIQQLINVENYFNGRIKV